MFLKRKFFNLGDVFRRNWRNLRCHWTNTIQKNWRAPFKQISKCGPVLIFFRYGVFSSHFYFTLLLFLVLMFLNVFFRLQKGHCTSGTMNIFLVWLRRILIKFCPLCLAVCTKSPKNTGIRKCLYVDCVIFVFLTSLSFDLITHTGKLEWIWNSQG